jgi:hypothetical protein
MLSNRRCCKWVWLMLCFDRRFYGLSKNQQTKQPSKVGQNPSDLDEMGCKPKRKTHPVVPVMVTRPETAKRILFLFDFRKQNQGF